MPNPKDNLAPSKPAAKKKKAAKKTGAKAAKKQTR